MNLDDAEKIKSLVVEPMVSAVRAELAPLVNRVTTLEGKVGELQVNQKKALIGYSAVAVLAGSIFGYAKDWVVRKFTAR